MTSATESDPKGNIDALFYLKQSAIMRNLIVMACVWSVTGVCFYINNSFLKRIPGDFQLNTLVANCADLVMIPFSTWLFMKGNSIKALLFTYSIFVAAAGLCMIMFLQ